MAAQEPGKEPLPRLGESKQWGWLSHAEAMAVPHRLGLALVLFVALAIAGGATLSTAGAQQVDEPSNVTITVGATGTVNAPPDVAVVDLAVEASADSADAAHAMVAANVTQLRDALRDANVSDDQLRTTYFVIQTERNETGTVTYRAEHGFSLRVPVDDAGPVVDAAVAGGATRVDGVRFTLAEETRRDRRADAIEDALTNARADADVIADVTDTEVRAVVTVETGDGGVSPVFVEFASDDGTRFDPGPVTVTASVTVTYVAS